MEVLIDLMSNNLIGTTLWLTTAIAGYIYSRKWINNEYKYSGKFNANFFYTFMIHSPLL